ncbi:hypothetical protein Tco_1461215, partial [Tanacetum coccineum]
IVDVYLANKMHEAIKIAIQLQSDRLKDEAQAENADFINKLDENIKKIIKDQVLTRSSNEYKTSHAVAANLSELELKKILIDKMESNKSIHRSDEQKNLYKALDKDEEPSARSNWGSKRRRARKEPESTSAPKEKTSKTTGKSTEGSKSHHKSADEPMHTAKDLEEPAHLEFETGVTKDQPDEETSQLPDCRSNIRADKRIMQESGHQYPHDLQKPLPLISNSRGRRVIPFDHFINNDLVYLSGVVSSRTYTTSVTKTKAGEYRNIKWIEDLVPNTMWRKSARDVYSKRRIIAVTKLQIVEWHNYKHLDWITVRRDDDKLYTFKEGNFNRLHIQDIKDMLLLLVQGKLSVIIQRRVEDLQLGVESYQKKLNLTKPDTYISDLKRREAYTTYSNPRGFIY